MNPRISICSSTYNHEKYVVEAIDSVLLQTCQDFELIITDDGSTDGNVMKIRQYKDPRITLFCHETNRGNMVASEKCYQHSRGDYLVWLTTDDVWEPTMLEVLAHHLDQHPELLGVFAQPSFIDDDGLPIPYQPDHSFCALTRFEHLNNLFRVVNPFCCPTAMIRRSTFDQIGYFPRHLRQIHDMAHWVTMLFDGDLKILPDQVLKFRIRAGNANAGSDTPENRRRINLEVLNNLQQYANRITNMELLSAIFPQVRQHKWPLEDKLVRFHLAHIALSLNSSVHRLFGLNILFELMANKESAEYLRQQCNFDYPDLYRLQGELPLFLYDIDGGGKPRSEIEALQILEDTKKVSRDFEIYYKQLLSSSYFAAAKDGHLISLL